MNDARLEQILAFDRAINAAMRAKVMITLITHTWEPMASAHFEANYDGMVIKGSAIDPDPLKAVILAWEKFERLARYGDVRLLAPGVDGRDIPLVDSSGQFP